VTLVGRLLLSTALAVCGLVIIAADVGSTGEPDGDTPCCAVGVTAWVVGVTAWVVGVIDDDVVVTVGLFVLV